jgi:hypothetical protein
LLFDGLPWKLGAPNAGREYPLVCAPSERWLGNEA